MTSSRRAAWQTFLVYSLIPLVLVEVGLLGGFVWTLDAMRTRVAADQRASAGDYLLSVVSAQSRMMDQRLSTITALTELYAASVTETLLQPVRSPDKSLIATPGGARYSSEDSGGGAFFYSSITPRVMQDLEKVAQLRRLNPLMKSITASSPLITSVYFNTWDSLNHRYPWVNPLSHYPQDINLPSSKVYYPADMKHNPHRKTLWTAIEPAPGGTDWRLSSIAPIYREDYLEGVVGVELDVAALVATLGRLSLPWEGDVMVLGLPQHFPSQESAAGLDDAAITVLQGALDTAPEGSRSIVLGGENRLVAWAKVAQTDWTLVATLPESTVAAAHTGWAEDYQRMGYPLIAGLIVFHLAHLLVFWWRHRYEA